MKKKIILIDDSVSYCEPLCRQLEESGYLVHYSPSAEDLEDWIETFHPDILFLDIELQDNISGIDICKSLQARHSALPIIMISNHDELHIRTRAVETGAISYIQKPLSAKLLSAYVERFVSEGKQVQPQEELEIDFARQIIRFADGNISSISPTQTLILKKLYDNKGTYLSAGELMDAVWGQKSRPARAESIICNTISTLRQILMHAPTTYLRSKRGIGYGLIQESKTE